jgi:hypothetical protein
MHSMRFNIVEQLSNVNLVKDVNYNLPAESHRTLNRWKKSLRRLLQVVRPIIFKQTGMHTVEPLLPEPSTFRLVWLLK